MARRNFAFPCSLDRSGLKQPGLLIVRVLRAYAARVFRKDGGNIISSSSQITLVVPWIVYSSVIDRASWSASCTPDHVNREFHSRREFEEPIRDSSKTLCASLSEIFIVWNTTSSCAGVNKSSRFPLTFLFVFRHPFFGQNFSFVT